MLSDALRGSGGLLGDLLQAKEPQLTPISCPTGRRPLAAMGSRPGQPSPRTRCCSPRTTRPTRCPLHRARRPAVDEWTEVVPRRTRDTGVAVHFDGPDSEPPQAMLLVVPPVRTGTWSVDDLSPRVNETYELAKSRAVEPEHSTTRPTPNCSRPRSCRPPGSPITISTDLALANQRWKASP